MKPLGLSAFEETLRVVEPEPWDRHLPIVTTLSMGYRANARGGNDDNRPPNPMRLHYCASELRSAKKAALAGSVEDQGRISALRRNVEHIRDNWSGDNWDDLWNDVEG